MAATTAAATIATTVTTTGAGVTVETRGPGDAAPTKKKRGRKPKNPDAPVQPRKKRKEASSSIPVEGPAPATSLQTVIS